MSLAYLPDHSRIWIFQPDRELSPEENQQLSAQMIEFVSGWQAHGKDLLAGYEIFQNAALIVAVDELSEAPSGCSIDKVFRLLAEFGNAFQMDYFFRLGILAKTPEGIKIYSKNAAESAWNLGEINGETEVLNTLIPNLGEWRKSPWIPLNKNWLGQKLLAVNS